MAKQVIRLTESDLHNIINEAVKEALNELDPRTYASAAAKAQEKGDKRASKFGSAAASTWNREYGNAYSFNPGNYTRMQSDDFGIQMGNNERIGKDSKGWNVYKNHQEFYDPHKDELKLTDYENHLDPNRTRHNDKSYYVNTNSFDSDYGKNTDSPSNKFTTHKSSDNISKMSQKSLDVARQMAQNNGKYIKGQGWQ